MPRSLAYTQSAWEETYSEIIDVRSPGEFAEDRIPGAINLPVLDDPQRAEVGTIYKQVDPFMARKLGAALVAKNIATHLQSHFATKDKNYHPLVYCWRGGQRSHSLATVLGAIGWQVTLLEGGYKTYRAWVLKQLETLPAQFTYRILAGPTGSGKTRILRHLQSLGAPVLDLEALANHRGSVLGEEWQLGPTPQPSQKYFESLLVQALRNLESLSPVWVESESNKIGALYLPRTLWEQMKQASGIALEVPDSARIDWLLRSYPHLTQHPELLKGKVQRLKYRYGGEKLAQWEQLIDAGDYPAFVADILACHYDPAYKRSLHLSYPHIHQTFTLSSLDDAAIAAGAEALLIHQ
ncbi:tRNA 2-selenouridine(34) synthase MnmH [[Phormidium] sp. ETS-05]|uniref:tRNA 2-selenouridine(34) synthase MnmH n=1 Tax=[Phormidium] sp. ETS-05 TaxID=222819 RepID=UPI0018EF066A|nr:tRNA 2-selenouridine(34) synthase MnmH [[Phormidium] sp. ETS-05]